MSRSTEYISNTLSLREPLRQSLEVFEVMDNQLDLLGNADLKYKEALLIQQYPLFKQFERSFPSVCFSIATGIGKTRLMGAFIAYLYKEKGFKNFFILSPNITIYNKLRLDFGSTSYQKYVFKGFPEITNNAVIIDGDNYETKGIRASSNSIQINMFNIGKINADTKATNKDGENLPPRLKRFRETLGDSYYNYLMSLEDLVIIMDEAHRYRGDRGMDTLNELNPILGIELTATPYDSKFKQAFKNIVFEYGLKEAINETNINKKYIKTPAVVTRADTDFSQMDKKTIEKLKLQDAIQLHNDTKIAIESYAIENNKRVVKPIILVACSDTTHAEEVYDYITSMDFYNGIYTDKTLQIDSSKSEDSQIEQLLTIEHPDNIHEIVIHVDMLKEGWDVSNLYTIVPLRASDAKILIEQTIGRGLRLPYDAKPTGVEKVDMLSIIEHERFQDVLDLAKDKDYQFSQRHLTEQDLHSKKILLESKTNDEVELANECIRLETITDDQVRKIAEKKHYAKDLTARVIRKSIVDKKFQTPNDILKPETKTETINEIKNILNTYPEFSGLTEKEKSDIVSEADNQFGNNVKPIIQNNILIPNIKVSLSVNKSIIRQFDLDITDFSQSIFDKEFQLIRETLSGHKRDVISINSQTKLFPEQVILEALKQKPKVAYENNPELFYNLCEQAVNAIRRTLKNADTLNDTILMYRELIVTKIYAQIEKHFEVETVHISEPQTEPYTLVLPFLNLTVEKGNEVLPFRQTISAKLLPLKVFSGFSKSCHNRYKFDSLPEKRFAEILDNSNEVIKWLRPASKQFNIWYNNNSDRYVPDFVAETAEIIYLIEIKAENEMDDKIVKLKAEAAINYCEIASKINRQRNEKDWKYVLVPHDKTDSNMSFMGLVEQFEK